MAYSNNHYVPRLVLRRYNTEKLTIYNVKTGEVHKDKQLTEIFAEQDLYGEELEKLLAKRVESPFAQILTQKILPAAINSEIELSRKELNIIKKFLLVEQMRVFTEEGEKYYQADQRVADKQSKIFKYPFKENDIENETVKERWLRNLRVIVECSDLNHIQDHELCTYDVYRWAQIYNSGYLAIWDCSETEEDFIVTDMGMTSERELNAFPVLEFDKKLYLLEQQETEKDPHRRKLYKELLFAQFNFHENFYMFSISKNRMIVIINPFFRLYDKAEKMPEPDIWPTVIDRSLYAKNRAQILPTAFGKRIFRDGDLFWYRVLPMSLKDLRWVNMLMLDRIDTIVGFSDIEKIVDSVCDYKDFYDDMGQEMRVNYNPLIKYFKDNDIID